MNSTNSSLVGATFRKGFHRIDMFGERVPGFHIRGQEKAKSLLGGCVSFIVIGLTLLFAALKFQ